MSERQDVQLTDRERQVLGLIAEGLRLAIVAEKLEIPVSEVKNIVASVRRKIGAGHVSLRA